MNETYTQAKQAINCRGRQCLRICQPVRSATIQRRAGQTRTTTIELASSLPTTRWCSERCKNVPEVLDLSGYVPRGNRIPIIDGDRSSIRNVVGSVHGIKVQGKQLLGSIVFARDKRSQDLAAKYNDHHLPGLFESEIIPFEIQTHPDRDVVTRFEIVAVRII